MKDRKERFTRLGSHTRTENTSDQQILDCLHDKDYHIDADFKDCKDSKITLNRIHASIRHRWPRGTIKKKDCISISLAIMPSFVEGRAFGKARKKIAVARRSSIRARCMPKQTLGISPIGDLTGGQHQETYSLIHHQMVKKHPSFL